MPRFDYDLIVIGAGAGGLTAATFAGQSSAKTLLIEKEKKLGGDCLHHGCVPSKSLIKSATAYHLIRNAEKYGLPKVHVPRPDFTQLSRRLHRIIDVIQEHDEPQYLSEKFNVETRFGTPRFLDPHTIELDGQPISARYFVVATGSSPQIPDISGIKDAPFITNLTIFDLPKLPDSMIVLGGGPIGVEMAQAFGRLGCAVTIIQSRAQLLPREDEDVARCLHDVLIKEGIDVRLNSRAAKIEKNAQQIRVTLQNGATIEAQTLLVAVGRQGNIDGLGLEKIGVAFGRGIKTDARMRTTVKNIYAVGDVCETLPFTHVASYEAVVAVTNCILKIPRRADYRWVPWCTYTDPEVASVGYNEKRAREAGLVHRVHKTSFERNDRALVEGENKGFLKIVMDRRGRPLGAQIIGFHAGDLIHEWVAVLNGRMKLAQIANAIHAYPTLSEINKNASVEYLVSRVPSWTKKLTKFLYGYQGKA